MARNAQEVRRRIQPVALELFRDKGYELTTAAEIAAGAGVTERTFFRHFSDKREMPFYGETVLGDALTAAMRDAPAELGPWETLLRAIRSVEQLFIENRAFSKLRRRTVARSAALQDASWPRFGHRSGR
jgi:AcrR family transcriptional regulator